VTYQYVCEPCRQALGLLAERSYLSRLKRETGGFSVSGTASKSPPIVVSRDSTGKPFLLGRQQKNFFVTTLTSTAAAFR
jgi:hypothetical protein